MSGQYFCYLARKESLLNSLNVSKDDQLIERKYSEDEYEGFLQRYPSMDNLHLSPFNADNNQPIKSFHTDTSQPFRSFHTDISSQPFRSKSLMIKKPKNKAIIKNIDNKIDNPQYDNENNNQDLEHDRKVGLKLEDQKRWKKRRNTFHNVSLSVEKNEFLSKVELAENTNEDTEDNQEVKTSKNISSAILSKNNNLTGGNNKQSNSSTDLIENQSDNLDTKQKVSTNIANDNTNIPNETKLFKSLSIKDRADSVGSASFINLEQIKDIITNELHSKLENKVFNSKKVTVWCREISNSINDKVRKLTNDEQKVIVTTYIGSNINNEVNLHVSIKCEKVLNDDDFITIAIEGDTMFAWVSLFIAKF